MASASERAVVGSAMMLSTQAWKEKSECMTWVEESVAGAGDARARDVKVRKERMVECILRL